METLRAQGGGGTFVEAVHPPLWLVITALPRGRGVVVGVTHLVQVQKDAQPPCRPAIPLHSSLEPGCRVAAVVLSSLWLSPSNCSVCILHPLLLLR